ncbi:hypothetical protein [Amycolatopsis sp. NPDC021455]|uniref:hypothetical protein n=1 Tax=Amycolatopsis sp. NPDC021455 TaxID=3154901 RepID=UPI0033E59650
MPDPAVDDALPDLRTLVAVLLELLLLLGLVAIATAPPPTAAAPPATAIAPPSTSPQGSTMTPATVPTIAAPMPTLHQNPRARRNTKD